MRKKSGFTVVEQAIALVPEFEKVVGKLQQQVTLRGQSKSTLNNYIRRIGMFVIHFGKLPEQIGPAVWWSQGNCHGSGRRRGPCLKTAWYVYIAKPFFCEQDASG